MDLEEKAVGAEGLCCQSHGGNEAAVAARGAVARARALHAASGTYYYTFIWGMAGENLYYNDKDNIPVIDIR